MNSEQAHYLGRMLGIPSFLPDFRKIKERVGLTKQGVPTVSGTDDSERLTSLLEALKKLGLIEVGPN